MLFRSTVESRTRAFTRAGILTDGGENVFDVLERDCSGVFKKAKDGFPTLSWKNEEGSGETPPEVSDVLHTVKINKPDGVDVSVVIGDVTIQNPDPFTVKEGTKIKIVEKFPNLGSDYIAFPPTMKVTNPDFKYLKSPGVYISKPIRLKVCRYAPYVAEYTVLPHDESQSIITDPKPQTFTIDITHKKKPTYVTDKTSLTIYKCLNIGDNEFQELKTLNIDEFNSCAKDISIDLKNNGIEEHFSAHAVKMADLLKTEANANDIYEMYALGEANGNPFSFITYNYDYGFENIWIVSSFKDKEGNEYVPQGYLRVYEMGALSELVSGISWVESELCIKNGEDSQSDIKISQNNLENYKKLCRSEERRVGKECRSRWSPYH